MKLDASARLTLLELENADLRVRLKMARDLARKRLERLRKRRVPVVLEVEPSGDVTLYADSVDLALVVWPAGAWADAARNTVEEWLTWQLEERHRDLYTPGCIEARVNGENCKRTLAQAYEAYERMLAEKPVVKALVELSKREREAFTKGKKDDCPKGKANNETASRPARAGFRGPAPTRAGKSK